MREDHRAGAQLERALDHLARVDAGLRERAAKHLLELQQVVLRVEEHHGEHLVVQVGELHAQVVLDPLRRVEHRPVRELLQQRAARELHHRSDLGALGRAQPLDALQVGGHRLQQPRQALEAVEQLLRELQHGRALQAGAQQQGDELGGGQRRGAEREQFLARTSVRRNVLEDHVRRRGRCGHRLVKLLPVYPTGPCLEFSPPGVVPDPALSPRRSLISGHERAPRTSYRSRRHPFGEIAALAFAGQGRRAIKWP